MLAFLRQIAVFPLRMVAEAAGIFTFIDATALWSACWKLSGDGQDACRLLHCWLPRHGLASTRPLAEQMLARAKDSEIAATMAIFEYVWRQDWPSVTHWLTLAKDNHCINQQMLLYVELLLSGFLEQYDTIQAADAILARNDLPGSHTSLALVNKAHVLMEERRWDEVEATADRMLTIEDNPAARVLKWAACMARSRWPEAAHHLQAARSGWKGPGLDAHLAIAWLALGKVREAMECLFRCDMERLRIYEWKDSIGRLARSAEFAAFCAERKVK